MIQYFLLSWVVPFAASGAFVGYIVWHNRPLSAQEAPAPRGYTLREYRASFGLRTVEEEAELANLLFGKVAR
jgi:hypothetical protein